MEKQQMLNISQYLETFLVLPFSYIVEFYFYNNFLGFKGKAWRFVICALSITGIDFSMMKIASEPVRIFLIDSIWLVAICFLCYGEFLIKFYAVLVKETIMLLISLTFLLFDFRVLPIIRNINTSVNGHIFIGFISNIFNDYLSIILLFLVLKRIIKLLKLKEKIMNFYQMLYLLVPCLSVYGLCLIFYFIQAIKIGNKKYYLQAFFPKVYYFLPLVSLALLLSVLITVYTFSKMLESDEQHEKCILMEQQFNIQVNHSMDIEGLYNGIRGIMHDMNNHIICLKNLADNSDVEGIEKYLGNIYETIEKLNFNIKTGNTISDAIINEKCNIAKAEGIEFMCDFIMPRENSIEPIDLCVILGNSLDNAIEACRRIDNKSISRIVSIKSCVRGAYLIIEISNSAGDKIKYAGNRILSTKSNTHNHGIGICNMEAAIKRYDGVLDIVEEKNKVVVTIMMNINKIGT